MIQLFEIRAITEVVKLPTLIDGFGLLNQDGWAMDDVKVFLMMKLQNVGE